MPDYPSFPVPSSVSAPALIDPVYRFRSDAGYEVRRSQTMRPRRRYVMEYLGKTTHEMRLIRHFFQQQRGGTLPFAWWHPTAEETVLFNPTTPILVGYTQTHGLMDGQMIGIFASPLGNARNGFWGITIGGSSSLFLNGSTAAGSGFGAARVYLPKATGIFSEDTMESPVRLNYGYGEGTPGDQRWNFQVTIEEQF